MHRWKRRDFVALLGGAAGWPLAARAQQGGKIARVGVLASDRANPVTGEGLPIFRTELHKLGFAEGQNLIIEHRRVDEGVAKAFAGANDLVAAKADDRVDLVRNNSGPRNGCSRRALHVFQDSAQV